MISGARAWSERVVARASFDGARALRLREPNGEDELALDGIDTRAATAFLSRLADCPDEVPALAATDRDALLAALHRGLQCRIKGSADPPFSVHIKQSCPI